jgi:hypothetical protein
MDAYEVGQFLCQSNLSIKDTHTLRNKGSSGLGLGLETKSLISHLILNNGIS